MSDEIAATPTKSRMRSRGIALAILLTLTLAAGVAARIGNAPQPTTPGGSGDQGTAIHAGGVALSATLDRHSVLAGSDGTVRLELVMRGDERPASDARRAPTDLVVILDRSGSMQGDPLRFAKSAVFELQNQLGENDRFGLVTYATGGEIAIALERATAEARARWDHEIGDIRANGGTNMSRGLDLAHQLVAKARDDGRTPRVILISDGHANQGDASITGLRSRASRAVPGEYVLSAVGVGQGFDENVMSAVADAGTGNFYYLPDVRQLAGVFADEFAAARDRIASALEVFFRPGDGIQVLEAAGLPLLQGHDGVRFHPGDLFAGQERRIWLTLRAPTGEVGDLPLGKLSLAFTDEQGARHDLRLEDLPQLACVAGEEDYYASFDADAYKRGSASEGLGALKEKVAAFMRAGQRDEAIAEVEVHLDKMEHEQLGALGYLDAPQNLQVERLRQNLSAPAALEPSVQKHLAKELLEEGRDDRRVGSKRK